MKTSKIGLLLIAVLCSLTLAACGGGKDDAPSEGDNTGGVGGGGGGGTTPLTCANGGGFPIATYGVYSDSLTVGSTFTKITVNLSSTQTGALGNVTIKARACGFGGTILQTVTGNTANNLGTNGSATTYTFPGAVTVPNCSGSGTVAFEITNNSGGAVSVWGQSSGAGSCGGKISSDLTTTPPTQQAGVWYANITLQ